MYTIAWSDGGKRSVEEESWLQPMGWREPPRPAHAGQPHCHLRHCACALPHPQTLQAPRAANRTAPAHAGRRVLRLPRGLDRRTALAYVAEGHAGRQPDFRGFTYNPTTGRAALV
jgi:hypothetical protein